MKNRTRRTFLKESSVLLAAGTFLNLKSSAAGANEKIVLALVGGKNKGRDDALDAIRDGAEIKTFCDIDDAVLEKVGADLAKAQGKTPGFATTVCGPLISAPARAPSWKVLRRSM